MSKDLSSAYGVSPHPHVGWAKLLDEHGVQFVALDACGDGDLLDYLHSCGDWEVRWQISGTVLLARATPQSQVGASSRAGAPR